MKAQRRPWHQTTKTILKNQNKQPLSHTGRELSWAPGQEGSCAFSALGGLPFDCLLLALFLWWFEAPGVLLLCCCVAFAHAVACWSPPEASCTLVKVPKAPKTFVFLTPNWFEVSCPQLGKVHGALSCHTACVLRSPTESFQSLIFGAHDLWSVLRPPEPQTQRRIHRLRTW